MYSGRPDGKQAVSGQYVLITYSMAKDNWKSSYSRVRVEVAHRPGRRRRLS